MFEKILSIEVKNKVQPIHWHDVLEIIFVLKGRLELIRTNDRIYLNEKDIFVLNRDDIHCIKNVGEDAIYIETSLDLKLFEQFLPGVSTLLFKCEPHQNDVVSENLKEEIRIHISNVVNEMTQEVQDEKMIIYRCVEILNILKLGFLGGTTAKLKGESNEKVERLWKIVDYMYDHCQEKLLLKDVASHVYISEAYVSTILKEETGKSFEEFLSFIRSEVSIHYLLTTKMSVTNIAYECGFSAPRYYNIAFEKYYGCTPKEYREKNITFFKLEKKEAVPYVKYDKNIEQGEIQNLLSTYANNYVIESNISTDEIVIDLTDEIQSSKGWIDKATVISCSEEDLIYFSSLGVMKNCLEELGITTIFVNKQSHIFEDVVGRILHNIGAVMAKTNVMARTIGISDLFTHNGVKTDAYYKQKIFNEIEEPYKIIDRGAVVYKKDLTTTLILSNEKDRDMTYIVQYLPDEKKDIYVQKMELIKESDTEVKELLIRNPNIGDDTELMIEGLFAPTLEYQVLKGDQPMIVKIILQKNQTCRLSIQKISE